MTERDIFIVSDPLSSEFGPTRPVILIAEELSKRNFHVRIISMIIAYEIKKLFKSKGVSVLEVDGKASSVGESLTWFKAWLSEALYSENSRKTPQLNGIVLNFSNVIAVKSCCWYAQGPPTVTLHNIKTALPWHYRLIYNLGAPFFRLLDKNSMKKFAKMADKVIVNSEYLKSVYNKFDIDVYKVIYPPLDCDVFKPMRLKSSPEYTLTYFGKETNFSLLKKLADLGVKIKLFGGKMISIPKKLRNHPNLILLGRVTNERLVKLYSNAQFTIYPFLDEPFGYIPVESMACGTPVLTFNLHGPRESVIHGVTGWLADNDKVFIDLALKLWKNGYTSTMPKQCRKRALSFDKKKIAERWAQLLKV